MPLTDDKIADLRVKHLEMVQAIVVRMAGYSATLKNYCITLVAAISGFSVTVQKPLGAVLSLVTAIVFLVLDAQYLRLERQFRSLYDSIRREGFEVQPSFKIDLKDAPLIKFSEVFLSWSIGVFYIPLLVGITSVSS